MGCLRASAFLVVALLVRAQEGEGDALVKEGIAALKPATAEARARARTLFQQALEIARRTGATKLEIRAAALVGNTLAADDRYDEAMLHYSIAADAARAIGDRAEELRARHNIAAQHWSKGDADRALALYREVLPGRRALSDPAGVGYTWYGIAAAHWSTGDSAAALDAYRQALEIWRDKGDTANEANTRNSMGLVLDALGEHDRAAAEFETALSLWRKSGNAAGEAYTRNNQCLAAIGRKSYREAEGLCSQALPALEKSGDRRGQAYALHNLGSATAGLGQHTRAIGLFERSLSLKREIGDRWGQTYSVEAIGESHLTVGKSHEARRFLEQALADRRTLRDRAGAIRTLGLLARLDRDTSNSASALARISEAVALVESTRASIASQDRRATYFADRQDYYAFLVDTLMRMGRGDQALEASLRAQGRLLLDRVADTIGGIRQGVDPKLASRRADLDRRVRAQADLIQRLASAGKAAPTQEFDRLMAESRDLDEQIRRTSPRFATLLQPTPPSLVDLRRLLGSTDTILVHYFTGAERGWAWLVTTVGARAYVLPPKAELEAEVARFYESVSKRKAGAVGLGALLEPIRAARGAKRVLVSAGGALESVPFAALPLDGEPLAARLELVHVPSTAAVALRRSNRAASPTKPVAILADPDFGGAFPRLRFSGIEAEQVKSILPLATVATGADASRDRFDRLAPRDFEILHFATHAFVDPRRPELSGIILANGGSLRLPEIYNLDLRARLVVLSACRSATGADLPGEGVVGLARAFLYAGARGVLATLWDVDDRASAELVRRFYAGMVTQRLTPAAALRAAQDSLRADPRWRDPYFWAGLTLHGDWI